MKNSNSCGCNRVFLYTEYLTVVVSSGVDSDLSSVDLFNQQCVSNTGSGCLCSEESHTPGKMTVLDIGNVDFVNTSCSPVLGSLLWCAAASVNTIMTPPYGWKITACL